MVQELFVPKLGQTVEEITLIDWLVKDGDQVEQGQPVLEVETDKAVFPVEANVSGIIHLGPYKKSDIVPVITVVAVIGNREDRFPDQMEKTPFLGHTEHPTPISLDETANPDEAIPNKVGTDKRLFASPRARRFAQEKGVDLHQVASTGRAGVRIIEKDVQKYLNRVPKATPVAKRVAAEAGISLETLVGSGLGGRITRADVERFLPGESIGSLATSTPAMPVEASSPGELEVLERLQLTGVRGVIAERMSLSAHTTARVTLFMEVDATQLTDMRERLKAKVEQEWGFVPGYNDLLARIVVIALRKFPYMNARLKGDAIEHIRPIHLGMAVETEYGLLVPVIHNADQKSLLQFGIEFRHLIELARNRKLALDALSGGTFTLTSLGSYGVDAFTPVINLPEAAILGIGRIAPKPVVINDKVVVRNMCTLSLAFDHRLVDGAPAARFLAYIKNLVEEPYIWVATLH